jgi:hypothetical protein
VVIGGSVTTTKKGLGIIQGCMDNEQKNNNNKSSCNVSVIVIQTENLEKIISEKGCMINEHSSPVAS